MATQAERRAATSQAVLRAARTAFGRHGFEATSIDEIARLAGVSKGAVYHHVESKEHLFREVLESVLSELAARVQAVALRAEDPLERIKAGSREVLTACRTPAIRQIYLLDGPTVLGWEAWRALDLRHFLALVERGLRDAMASNAIVEAPIASLAQLLGAAITEAALLSARARTSRERDDVAAALELALEGLRTGRKR